MGMILTTWSNSKDNTIRELKDLGHEILRTRKDGCGHTIRYRHSTLAKLPRKGDMVEFVDDIVYKDYEEENPQFKKKKAIVMGTVEDSYCVKGHVGLKNTIECLSRVTRIIKRQMIPERLFKYL